MSNSINCSNKFRNKKQYQISAASQPKLAFAFLFLVFWSNEGTLSAVFLLIFPILRTFFRKGFWVAILQDL